MFSHVFFLFPETSQKLLEEVEEIFDDTSPGSIRLIGIPAWYVVFRDCSKDSS